MNRLSSLVVITALLALVGCGEDTPPDEAGLSKDEASRLGATDDGVDYCARYGWYDDEVCDDFCSLPDPDCGDAMAARCQGLTASSPASERGECCDTAPYPYCSAVLASQDGEGPSLCIGVRGNGQRITSHFGALARLYEHYGLFDGVAGGSSASITSFLVDSVQMNPAVRCDGCTPHEQGGRAALLFKSLRGYFAVLAGSEEGLAIQTLARVAGEAQNGGVASLLESDPSAGVAALMSVLQSPEIAPLVNPEILGLLSESPNPVYHARDIMGALQNAANFDASDPTIFVRPGVLDFSVLAMRFGRIGSFYAGYAPVDSSEMTYFLDECAESTRGMSWTEAESVATRDGGTCGEIFADLATNFRETLLADEASFRSRADDTVGDTLPVLISTGVLEGDAIATWTAARATYNNAEPIEWETNFDDVRLGYFGHPDDIARVMENPNGYMDLKTQKRRVLDALSWGEVLSLSPAEPGLARGLAIPGDERISVGGWSDLQPVLALRNMGCEKVIYVTRRGRRSGFFNGVTTLLGIDEGERSALIDLESDSSFRLSLEEAAGVWCTDWDTPPETDLEAMYADGYNAPFETTDTYFSAVDGYDGVVESTGLAGCTPGQP